MPKKKHLFGKKVVNDLLLLGANEAYKTDIKRLSKKYNPPDEDDLSVDGKKELEFLQSPKSREMTKEYLEMMDKYGMTELFDFLMQYIIEKKHIVDIMQGKNIELDPNDAVEYLLSNSGIKVVEKKKEYLTLNIYSDTALKDIQQQWPEIKELLNKKAGRKKESKNLKRDLKILSLKNEGLRAMEIKNKINSDPDFGDQKITYQEVSRIIKRLKVKAQKNMPHKNS